MNRHEAEVIGRKVNIGKATRKILTDDTAPCPPQDLLDENFLDQHTADATWLNHAEEGYALTSILTHEVIEYARSQRESFPPYGLAHPSYPQSSEELRPTQEVESLHELSDAFLISLRMSKESVFKKHEDQLEANPHLSKAYARYKKIHGFTERYFERPKIDINSGTRTAILRMENAAENIIGLLMKMKGESPTIQDFETTARNSWPYIAMNASSHLHTLRASRMISMHPKSHTLLETKNGLMLSYTDQAQEDIAQSAARNPIEPSELRPTFGCVGLVDFNGNNAVHNLWDWYIDSVKTLHEKNFQGKPVNALLGIPSPFVNI